MQRIAITNQKGGVGKTVTALNLAHGLARKGRKVLLVDFDSQASLTSILLKDEVEGTIYDLISAGGDPDEYIYDLSDKAGLRFLPSDSRLARIESVNDKGREALLKHNLGTLRGFEYVIIDCAPSLGLLTVNALVAAEGVIIPVKTDYLSLQGIVKINSLVDIVQGEFNKGLRILGYLPCQYDRRRVLDNEVLSIMNKRFKNVFPPIRQNISIGESPSWGQSIFEYRADSTGAKDYERLVKAVMKS